MKNLGDKLQEARTALSLSVRDVADATRLRAYIIENMEAGKFDYPLPEIYKRGFLRIYAAFLKLDVPSILSEYESTTRTAPRDDSSIRHLLQRAAHKELASNESVAPAPSPSMESRYPDEAEFRAEASKSDEDTLRYIKFGGVFAGLILAAVVIVLIVSSLVKGGGQPAPEENPDIAAPQSVQAADISAPVIPQTVGKKSLNLAITALEETYVIAYPENDSQKLLISGPMQVGERREFKSESPIMVKLTDAERVKLERNSKQIDLGGARGPRLFKITPQ